MRFGSCLGSSQDSRKLWHVELDIGSIKFTFLPFTSMKYTTFSSLTLGQYQQLYAIGKSESDETDKAVECVSVLTGLPRWEVEEMPITDFNKVSAELTTIFSDFKSDKPKNKIVLGGKKYLVQLNPRKLTAGQYIDIQHFLKGNNIENMHKVIACLVLPLKRFGRVGNYDAKNHEQISEQVRELPFANIHATCVFFLNLWRASTGVMQDYLKSQLKKTLTTSQYQRIAGMDFKKIMDGFTAQ
jgi:hypothetical protein